MRLGRVRSLDGKIDSRYQRDEIEKRLECEEQIKNLIAAKYEVIKYKKLAVIQEIQKIFREHIKSYMKRIGNKEDTEEWKNWRV